MVNTKATSDADIAELVRQFGLMLPALAAAAASAGHAAPTTPAPIAAPAATTPVGAAGVAAPTTLPSSQDPESQVIDISAGGKWLFTR